MRLVAANGQVAYGIIGFIGISVARFLAEPRQLNDLIA